MRHEQLSSDNRTVVSSASTREARRRELSLFSEAAARARLRSGTISMRRPLAVIASLPCFSASSRVRYLIGPGLCADIATRNGI